MLWHCKRSGCDFSTEDRLRKIGHEAETDHELTPVDDRDQS